MLPLHHYLYEKRPHAYSTVEDSPGALVNMILQLVKEGRISEKRIDESYRRIMRMKGVRP